MYGPETAPTSVPAPFCIGWKVSPYKCKYRLTLAQPEDEGSKMVLKDSKAEVEILGSCLMNGENIKDTYHTLLYKIPCKV